MFIGICSISLGLERSTKKKKQKKKNNGQKNATEVVKKGKEQKIFTVQILGGFL